MSALAEYPVTPKTRITAVTYSGVYPEGTSSSHRVKTFSLGDFSNPNGWLVCRRTDAPGWWVELPGRRLIDCMFSSPEAALAAARLTMV